jgi:alpha-tubulin suppressor-like RCC1 family protein
VMSGVRSMAAGEYFSLILKTDGTLWACGYNYYGQLGDGTTATRYTPVQVMSGVRSMAAGEHFSLILKTDGTLWACGYNYYGQLGDGTTTTRSTPVRIIPPQ